jgi:radical SAM superfamily enzyme
MENKNICQSCSMPLDKPELQGTEKDGSKSKEYCSYCYQNGAFTTPNTTLEEMKTMVKTQMEKMKMDSGVINMAVSSLPNLKRWKGKMASL